MLAMLTEQPNLSSDSTTLASEGVPASSVTPAHAVVPVVSKSEIDYVVAQFPLSGSGPTKLMLDPDAMVLDVHLIDGTFFLRVLEPVAKDATDAEEYTVVPAALNTILRSRGPLRPLPVRHGGIHFFMA